MQYQQEMARLQAQRQQQQRDQVTNECKQRRAILTFVLARILVKVTVTAMMMTISQDKSAPENRVSLLDFRNACLVARSSSALLSVLTSGELPDRKEKHKVVEQKRREKVYYQ